MHALLLGGDGKRRKTANDRDHDTVVFMTLPEDMMRELCSFLSVDDLFRFLGETCQSIRRTYYTPSVFFTKRRPLRMPVTLDMQYAWLTPRLHALFRGAPLGATALPVHVHLHIDVSCEDTMRISLSTINCVVQKVVADDVCRLPRVLSFLNQHRAFLRSVRVIEFGTCAFGPVDLTASDISEPFGDVEVVCIQSAGRHAADIEIFRTWFPHAAIHIGCMWCMALGTTASPRRIATIFAKAVIAKMTFGGPVPAELIQPFQQCAQRTVDTFVLHLRTPLDVMDVILAELERRVARRLPYQLKADLAGPLPEQDVASEMSFHAVSKYVTRLSYGASKNPPATPLNWELYTSVRKFVIYWSYPKFDALSQVVTFSTPEDCLWCMRDWRLSIAVVSARALRPADLAYCYAAIRWLASKDIQSIVSRGDVAAFLVELERVRGTPYLVGYDRAFRVNYNFVPSAAGLPSIEGYV